MSGNANLWIGKASVRLTDQQAVQVAGSERKLNALLPAHNPKTFAINAGYSTLGRLITNVDFLKDPKGYSLRGLPDENEATLNLLAQGKTKLLKSQKIEAMVCRKALIRKLANRQRRPTPMW